MTNLINADCEAKKPSRQHAINAIWPTLQTLMIVQLMKFISG
jgi:hypothetical protein